VVKFLSSGRGTWGKEAHNNEGMLIGLPAVPVAGWEARNSITESEGKKGSFRPTGQAGHREYLARIARIARMISAGRTACGSELRSDFKLHGPSKGRRELIRRLVRLWRIMAINGIINASHKSISLKSGLQPIKY